MTEKRIRAIADYLPQSSLVSTLLPQDIRDAVVGEKMDKEMWERKGRKRASSEKVQKPLSKSITTDFCKA